MTKLVPKKANPEVNDDGCHHDPHALQEVPQHMDESSPNAGVAVASQQAMGVAVAHGALGHAILVNLVVASAVGVEGGGVVQDVGHAAGEQRNKKGKGDFQPLPPPFPQH